MVTGRVRSADSASILYSSRPDDLAGLEYQGLALTFLANANDLSDHVVLRSAARSGKLAGRS